MQPAQFIMASIDRNDEIEFLFIVTHTHKWDKDAFKAIENHITKWLLTADGRKFVRSKEFDDVYFPWSEVLHEHPEVIATTPGVTKIEYLPCNAFAVGQDDNPAPWTISTNRQTGKRRIKLDHNMIEALPTRSKNMPKKKASNTANPEPSPRTQIVRYTAMATGPFYNTASTSGHTTQRKAMKEAADLQLDELYSIIVATVTVTIEPARRRPSKST